MTHLNLSASVNQEVPYRQVQGSQSISVIIHMPFLNLNEGLLAQSSLSLTLINASMKGLQIVGMDKKS